MKRAPHTIQQLLVLRREERPDPAYWREFLRDFHAQEREKALRESGVSKVVGRLGEWFSDLGPAKWAYGAGLAYATATLVFFLAPVDPREDGLPMTPVGRPVDPSPLVVPQTLPTAPPVVVPEAPNALDPAQEF